MSLGESLLLSLYDHSNLIAVDLSRDIPLLWNKVDSVSIRSICYEVYWELINDCQMQESAACTNGAGLDPHGTISIGMK